MEMSKLQEGESGNGTSVNIVQGTSAVSIDSGEQEKIIDAESGHSLNGFHKELMFPNRNFPCSSYRVGSYSEKEISVSSKETVSIKDTMSPDSAKGLEKQNSLDKRASKDSEISIFQAEKYFNEENIDTIRQSTIRSKTKSPFGSQVLYDSRHEMASPAINCAFMPGGITDTPTGSSEKSWNSRSGLLSNSVHKLGATDRRRQPSKRLFGCKCLCLSKNSMPMETNLIENRRSSGALMDSPVSSIKYSYAGLRRRVLGRLIEKQREKAFADNSSELSDFNNTTIGETGLRPPATSLPGNFAKHSKDSELPKRFKGISPRFMAYDVESDRPNPGEKARQRKMNVSFLEKEDDFSIQIAPLKSEEMSRPSLEVFGSPFPGTPDHAESCNSKYTTVNGPHHQMQPLDLHRHLVLFSLEQARKSFTFNSDSDNQKFSGPGKKSMEDIDQDKESESSSDLFEIENLGAHCSFRKRESLDNNPRIRCLSGSFDLVGVENLETPSAKSLCYEPSEASDDWSITTADIVEKISLENFPRDRDLPKKHKSLNGLDLSMLRKATITESSKVWSRTGSFLSCASDKSVRVAVPIVHSHSARYSYEKKGSSTSRLSKLG